MPTEKTPKPEALAREEGSYEPDPQYEPAPAPVPPPAEPSEDQANAFDPRFGAPEVEGNPPGPASDD